MAKASLGRLAYILALIGGIILVLQGLLSFVGMAFILCDDFLCPVQFDILGNGLTPSLGGSFWGIIILLLGIVAIYGAKRASKLTWDIVLMILGVFAGGLGGIVVLVGGIVGLVSKYV
jgi:di/tricarboxylate transporter